VAGAGDAAPAPGGFPATVTHQFGTTQIKAAPQRVVSVGYTDQDYLLALGVVPVAILRWFATQPRAVGPWAEPLLGGAQPQILPPTDLDFEHIVKLAPDLITGIQRSMKQEEYARLSAIAPTLSQPAGFVPFGVPWREQAWMIAAAVGQRDAMERIIADVEGQFAAARGANPQFAGKTFAAILTAPDGQYYAWTKQDGRVRFLEALGLTLSPRIDTGTATTFYNTYSRERINELEADVMLAFGQTPQALQGVKDDVLLQGLNVAKGGRIIYMEDQNVSQALSMNTVLSLPYAIEGVTPALARVVR
jgi:iron complex transport system substrate-binding protein